MSTLATKVAHVLEEAAAIFSKDLKELAKVDVIGGGGSTTALSVCTGYWYKAHTNDNFYYTMLTAVLPENKTRNKTIYYFVFPEYEVKIPLSSGDILMINPHVLHSCLNPKYNDCFIMSAYVSAKRIFATS